MCKKISKKLKLRVKLIQNLITRGHNYHNFTISLTLM